MSKNKKTKKPINAKSKKATIKKVAVAVVIAVVVATVAIGAAFLIKKHIEKKNFEDIKTAVTKEYETVDFSGDGKLVYVNYNGAIMPEEFARILNQAAVDSENACKAGGVALDMNGIQVSKAEFRMNYFETAYAKYQEALALEAQRGSNVSGFDYLTDPASQKYPQLEITWEEHFINETVEMMKVYYNEFERACNAETRLTDEETLELLDMFAQIANEDFVLNYGEGATCEMYCAQYIRRAYSEKFREDDTEKAAESFSENDVKKKFNESPEKYQSVDARIYAVEGGYDSSEMGEIKTEKDFLEYAEKNYRKAVGDVEFDIDTKTYNWCVLYDTVNNRYGGEVADWLFDNARKPGDIALLEGAAYKCLVYVEKTKYETFSSDVVYVSVPYDDTSSAEEQKQAVEKVYNEWKNGEATVESFKAAFADLGTTKEVATRAGQLDRSIDYWIHKEVRKSGDSTVYYTDNGAYVFYYVSPNPDDLDWMTVLKNELAAEQYRNDQKASLEQNFSDVKKNSAVITTAADEVYSQCAEFVNGYKEKQ